MGYSSLVWMGIWRKPGRTLLLLLQIAIVFMLYGVLHGLTAAVEEAIADSHPDRLYVMSKVTQGFPLPVAHLSQLRSVAGVVAVAPRSQFPATYQRPEQQIVGIATDIQEFLRIYPSIRISEVQRDALAKTRDGIVIGEGLASAFGWRIGDRVPLISTIPRADGDDGWMLEVVGTYVDSEHPEDDRAILLNWSYLSEARLLRRDTVDMFSVLTSEPGSADQVASSIDARFANSADETRTYSESELAEAAVRGIGDVELVTRAITLAAFVALLFATGTLLVQSIRERVPEFAILKVLGFSNRRVAAIIFAEVMLLCWFGALTGLLSADAILPLARQFVGVGVIPLSVFAEGFTYAALLALACGALPVWRGLRLAPVEALGR
jgi:putative ABC transport system permease protein